MIAAQLVSVMLESVAEAATDAAVREDQANGFGLHGWGEDPDRAAKEERIHRAIADTHRVGAAVVLAAVNHINGLSPE